MNNEEKYLHRIKALEMDVTLLKLAAKELARELAELEKVEYPEMCRRLGLDKLS